MGNLEYRVVGRGLEYRPVGDGCLDDIINEQIDGGRAFVYFVVRRAGPKTVTLTIEMTEDEANRVAHRYSNQGADRPDDKFIKAAKAALAARG